jgi:hypothetical protein
MADGGSDSKNENELAQHSDANVHHHQEGEVHMHHQKAETHKKNVLVRYKKQILVTIFYLAVALIMFYQITLNITTVAPGTGADTYQNLWNIWWVKYSIFTLHQNVFYTKLLFWPLGASLAFQTLSPLLGLISVPFQALFGTVFGYNVMFFIGFALSGLCMFILADYLTKNSYAALISGFIFTFSAFHIAQGLSHIHFTNIEFIPLFIYFLLKILDGEKGYKNIIGMAASFALTTMIGNIEQTIMVFMALVVIIVIFLFYKERRKTIVSRNFIISMVLFVVLAFIIGAWNFIPLIKAVSSSGGLGIADYLNSAQSNIAWSASPLAFFLPSYFNGILYHTSTNSIWYMIYAAAPVEKVAYIGYAVIALMLLAVYKYRKEMLPWAICAIIFAWLALGPTFGLYSIYHAIPALNVIREPGRFDLMASMFMAILAAYGAKVLFEHFGKEHHHSKPNGKLIAIVAIIILIMFIENNGLSFRIGQSTTRITVPSLYSQLGSIQGNFSILELPALPAGANSTYLYPGEETFYTSISKKPLVGGYLGGRQNISSTLLLYNIPLAVQAASLMDNGTPAYYSPVSENFTNQTLLTLYNYNTAYVTVHYAAFTNQSLNLLLSYMVETFGNPYVNDSIAVFQTYNAINNSKFKSFVSYPILSQWAQASIFLNGSYQTYWVPSGAGSIVVYAPYKNSSAEEINNQYGISYINTTIGFAAISNIDQTLYIDEEVGNSIKTIANVGVGTSPTAYTVNVPLESGPNGNPLLFLYKSNATPVLIKNITFSRGAP